MRPRVHVLLSRIEVVSMSKKPEHTQTVPVIGEGATLGVIGAGVMGQTLLRGLLSGKLIAHDRVWAGDKNPSTCDAASQALGIAVESDFHARVSGADLILLCVKTQRRASGAGHLRNAGLRRETLLISILAGVRHRPAWSRCSAPRIPWSAPCPTPPRWSGRA